MNLIHIAIVENKVVYAQIWKEYLEPAGRKKFMEALNNHIEEVVK